MAGVHEEVNPDLHPDPITRWKHRRRLAYLAMTGSLCYPLLLLIADTNAVVSLAWPFYGLTGSVLAAYIGGAVWETISINKDGIKNG